MSCTDVAEIDSVGIEAAGGSARGRRVVRL
jgi:hypothetical protein